MDLDSLVARIERERPEEVADLTGLQERVMGCHGEDEPSADDGAFGEWLTEYAQKPLLSALRLRACKEAAEEIEKRQASLLAGTHEGKDANR